MKKYEAYKDSGIEWIGMIPEGWECLRMKHFAELVTTPSTSDNKIGLENIESSTGRFIPTDSEFEGNGISFMPDDIVYGKLRPYLQKVWKADMEGNAVGDFFVLRCNSKSYPTYLKYLLLSPNFTSVANGSTYGAKMPRVSSEFMMNFSWFLPSYSEQQAIADYLDYKVGQIDTSVADINTQIEDLKAYRQAVISEAVTKGLNPDAPMKDSGIEWIGMIPEGWECTKLAWLYSNMGSGTTPDSSNYSYYSENGTNWLQTGDLNDGVITSTSKHVTDLALQEKGLKIYPVGSVVIAMYGATIGKVGLLSIETTTNQACCVLPPTEIMNNKYVFYLMQSSKQILISKSVGGGQPNISQAIIKEHRVPTPPLAEQQAIAEHLDKKTSKIDTAIKSLENQRDDLNALRQTVISEAVTGKIDLRDWKKNK